MSRPTLTTALNRLRSDGLLESRRGSGTWVATIDHGGKGLPMAESLLPGPGINLAAGVPADVSHLPELALGPAELLATQPSHGYDPAGLLTLRSLIADRYNDQDLPTSPDQILVTTGAQSALALLTATLLRAGDAVVVESLTYGGFLDLLVTARCRPISIARHHRETDPEQLDTVLGRQQPALVYLMPSLHTPTSTTTDPPNQRRLAEVLDRHGATVIADETLADVTHGERSTPLAALCRRATVVTVESLAKSVWGGLRIGWVRADQARLAPLRELRASVEISPSVPSQILAEKILSDFDTYLAKRRSTLTAKAQHFTLALRESFPSWDVPLPDGGLSLWADTRSSQISEFLTNATSHGVSVMPGQVARPDGEIDSHVRICFDRPIGILDQGITRLRAAWPDRGE